MGIIDYWFYLEPYTFLFKTKERYVIYNTVNAAYIDCSNYPERIQTILSELFFSDKTYCTGIMHKDLSEPMMANFIDEIRNTFSGDLIENKCGIAPYVCKPILHIYHHPDDPRTKEYNLLGINSLLYLHEVTFYLENDANRLTPENLLCFQQFPYPTNTGKQILDIKKYHELIEQLAFCQLDKITIIPGKLDGNKLLLYILDLLCTYKLKTEIILPYEEYKLKNILPLLKSSNIAVNIMVHLPVDMRTLELQMELFVGHNISWIFLVATEEHLEFVESLDHSNEKIACIPWFNGFNRSFFSTFVYIDLEDILEQPISRQKIFRRQVLNENFFGKLTVFPTGEVFANPNFPCSGNIMEQKLTEIVYHEINNPRTPWFMTRKNTSCDNCVNKFLCPSISNYEVVMNTYNMCYLNNV